jgi:hypothetical protein
MSKIDTSIRIEKFDQVYYPKEYVDWLHTLIRVMWSSPEKSYAYWLKHVKGKPKKRKINDDNDLIGTDWNNGEFYKD